MANIHSQKKRIQRAERERLENRRYTSKIKTYFRRLERAVATGEDEAADSEHRALVQTIDKAVKRGAHLVLDGPPGTGKSQTIANVIAEFLAAGKTVLFVSEKTAALEVVKRRLDRCGLGDYCLELHSHKASKKEVVAELGRCLELTPAAAPDDHAREPSDRRCRGDDGRLLRSGDLGRRAVRRVREQRP